MRTAWLVIAASVGCGQPATAPPQAQANAEAAPARAVPPRIAPAPLPNDPRPAVREPGPSGLKLFISADMEGVAGVVTDQQLGPRGFEYERFRRFMTDEVNAAIDAAYGAGFSEVVVADSHGNGQNLLIDRMPSEITVVRSSPRPLRMMQGIDASFAAAIFIGYHTGVTNPEGVRAHTISSAKLADVRIGGRSMSEGGMNAALAGHFGVPVVMVSGDDKVVEETRQLLGDVEGAVVKWSYGYHSAKTLTPAQAQAEIRERVTAALTRLQDFKPFRLGAKGRNVELELQFKNYRPAELLSYLRLVERHDAHTIRFEAADMVELSMFLEFAVKYEAGLTP